MSSRSPSQISVIVPLYNVADFIGPCIASLRAQTMPDFDVVIVNDGSTDRSPEVAHELIDGDPRFTLVHQDNHGPGPGGGRNGGLDHTRSDRLIFLDSDDALVPNTLETIVGAFDASVDIDVVSTSAARLCGASPFPSHLHDICHPFAETDTTAEHSPWLMFDSTPWNKAFHRPFFDRVVGRWPERQLYEDIAPMTKALLRAEHIAVIDRAQYLWRVRGEGSITHQQSGIGGDLAQLEQLSIARSGVVETGSTPLLRWFDWKTLTQDLLWMTKKLTVVSGAQRLRLFDGIRNAIDEIEPALVDATQPALRRCFRSILDDNCPKATRRATLNRLALLQDRRDPITAMRHPGGTPTLRRVATDRQGVSVQVTATDVDLRGSTLCLSTLPPWNRIGSGVEVRIPANRSMRTAAGYRVDESRVPDAETPRQWFVEIETRAGVRREITRSLVDAARRRLAESVAAPGPIRPFIDDGRLRLATGTPLPQITDITTDTGRVVLHGRGAPPDLAHPLVLGWLTEPVTNAAFALEWRHLADDRFELEVPTALLTDLSMQPHAISLSRHDNPSVPTPVAITAAARFSVGDRPGHVSPGQFDIAQLRIGVGSARRVRALGSELVSFLPSDAAFRRNRARGAHGPD